MNWEEKFDSMKIAKNELWIKVMFEGREKSEEYDVFNIVFDQLKPYLKPFIQKVERDAYERGEYSGIKKAVTGKF